jgi:RND family efflux transporter MFP subunit
VERIIVLHSLRNRSAGPAAMLLAVLADQVSKGIMGMQLVNRKSHAALVPFLALLVAACGKEPEAQAEAIRPVKILTVTAGGAGPPLEYPGTVTAAQTEEVAFEVAGKIVEFAVEEGQRVEAGTLLARIDDRDYVANVDAVKAKVNQTKGQADRYAQLFKDGVVSEAERDLHKRLAETAAAELRVAEKALEDTILTASFSGRVARKLVTDFKAVQAKEPILVLQDSSSLEVKIDIPEQDAILANPDLDMQARNERVRIEVFLSALPDRAILAVMKEFATAADQVTRTFRITVGFEAPEDVAIMSGMTARVVAHILASQDENIRVPSNATAVDADGNAYVWMVDPSSMRVRRATVTLGEFSGVDVAIQTGLSSGDQIAATGVSRLREGMQVSRLGE